MSERGTREPDTKLAAFIGTWLGAGVEHGASLATEPLPVDPSQRSL